jgi:predicted RNA binding protein YcfA (HicA-like mRNA interferase family)
MKKYGFVEHSRKGSHCTMKNTTTTKRVTIPVHAKPIGSGLLSAILKQAWLPKAILDT